MKTQLPAPKFKTLTTFGLTPIAVTTSTITAGRLARRRVAKATSTAKKQTS